VVIREKREPRMGIAERGGKGSSYRKQRKRSEMRGDGRIIRPREKKYSKGVGSDAQGRLNKT